VYIFKKLQPQSILPFALLCLLSCSPAEYNTALNNYNNAIKQHNLSSTLDSLKILAKFKPDEYKNELIRTIKLNETLTEAKKHMASKNYYQAYLNSHDVYRQSLDSESKALLISSGKKLTSIIKTQNNIEIFLISSGKKLTSIIKTQNNIEIFFKNYPKDLSKVLKKLAMSPVISWNLIEVNQLVSQLSKSRLLLKSALFSLENNSQDLNIPEIKQWTQGIATLLTNITYSQNFIVNRARYQSAIALLDAHKLLTKESTKLLSYVHEKIAIKTLTPTFYKAESNYQPYQVLIENISLALLLNRSDIHSVWYTNWQKLESDILLPKMPFSNYPIDAKNIDQQLNELIIENTSSLTTQHNNVNTLTEFSHQYPQVNTLVKKLKRDKALI